MFWKVISGLALTAILLILLFGSPLATGLLAQGYAKQADFGHWLMPASAESGNFGSRVLPSGEQEVRVFYAEDQCFRFEETALPVAITVTHRDGRVFSPQQWTDSGFEDFDGAIYSIKYRLVAPARLVRYSCQR